QASTQDAFLSLGARARKVHQASPGILELLAPRPVDGVLDSEVPGWGISIVRLPRRQTVPDLPSAVARPIDRSSDLHKPRRFFVERGAICQRGVPWSHHRQQKSRFPTIL